MNSLLLKNYFTLFEGTKLQINIYYYAICIMLGMLAAALCAIPLFKKRGFNPEMILDVMIAIIPLSIIFARAWYVVMDLDQFTATSFFSKEYDPDGVFSIRLALSFRDGGMAIHGGILGGAIGLIIVSAIKKVKVGRLCDLGASLLPLGQAIGRLGNYFNQEVYGKVTDITWFPYATFIEKTGQYHVALCFHEMFLNLLLFIFLYVFLMNYKGKRNGYSVGFYFLFYGIIRAVMEPMRDAEFNMGNSEPILGLPAMTWISILIIIVAVALLIYLFTKDIKDKDYWWKGFFKKQDLDGDNDAIANYGDEEVVSFVGSAKISGKVVSPRSSDFDENV